MGTITLSVPDELKARMDKTDWVNWSSVARRAFADTLGKVEELEHSREASRVIVESIASKSRLSEEEADKFAVKLGREIKKGRFGKLKKLGVVK